MTEGGTVLAIHVDLDPRINFAMQQNDVPVVQQLRVENRSAVDLCDLDVSISLGGALLAGFSARLDRLPSGKTHSFGVIDLELDGSVLMRQLEREVVTLRIEVARGSEVLAHLDRQVELLAFDEWGGLASLPEVLAAFVLPNHPVVDSIVGRTADHLEGRCGERTMRGYQARDPEHVRNLVRAVYAALAERDLHYTNPPASFEQEGQKVRLPDRILEHGVATCLDLALLSASVCEQIGLNTLIVFVQGHAFLAVWTGDESFSEPVMDDVTCIKKRIQLGEMLAVEVTGVTVGLSYEQAERDAFRALENGDEFLCAIDVSCARQMRIRPLPMRATETGLEVFDAPLVVVADTPLVEPAAIFPSAEAEAAVAEPETRLDRWKRKLLDLSLRNRLINYRESKKTIPILCTDLGELEDALAEGDTFSCLPRPSILSNESPRDVELHRERTGVDAVEDFLHGELARRRLHADLSEDETAVRLLEVYRAARSGLEESGANTLYLAFGFLCYYEAKSSEVERRAPILLIPIQIERRTVREGFRIRMSDDDARINVTLLEMLSSEFPQVDTRGLAELPGDESGLDVDEIMRRFRTAIRDIERWDIDEVAHIGLFSFTKFLMWRDLHARSDLLLKNRVLNHLVMRPGAAFEPDAIFPEVESVDEEFDPAESFCPLDADSTQLAAVRAAQSGHSFVLMGPPGTGKSQTITNLIAQLLGQGKRVLFVSEKMAALEVVYRRLRLVGLAPFSLQLHSNKSSKREVLDQLIEAFEVTDSKSPAEWLERAAELRSERQHLNEYVRAIHRPRGFGASVFEVTSELIGLRSVRRIRLDLGRADAIGRDTLTQWREAVERLATALLAVGIPVKHALRGVRRGDWRAELADEVDGITDRLIDATMPLTGAIAACRLGIDSDALSRDELRTLRELILRILKTPGPTLALCTEPGWRELKTRCNEWIESCRQAHVLREHVLDRTVESALDLDLDALYMRLRRGMKSWPIFSWFRCSAVRKLLRPLARSGHLPANEALAADLLKAIELKRLQAELARESHEGQRFFGAAWERGRGAIDRLAELVEYADGLRTLLLRAEFADRDRCAALASSDRDSLAPEGTLGRHLREFLGHDKLHRSQLEALTESLELDLDLAFGAGEEPGFITRFVDACREIQRRRVDLNDWCHWRRVRGKAVECGLDSIVLAAESGQLSADDARQVFDRSFYEWWLNVTIDSEEVLRHFNSREHERRIEKFRELDEKMIRLAREELRARLSARVPRWDGRAADASELGILQRQHKLKRRHMPVRKLFQRLPNLLPMLKPCVLMSPLSIAQYLDAEFMPFDIVVFDEASQIPVWDAVGAIARASSAIVVGDSKQLPPTSFFHKVDEEDLADDEFEEVESILDECSAAGLRLMRLLWHYRSRHESLITFSNYHYYNNRLLTFPSAEPTSDRLGVSLQFVENGCYDRGKSRTNRIEAEAVVAEMLRRLQGKVGRVPSLGVVTFSMAQQRLVEDLIDEVRRFNPAIERFFTDEVEEPVFIKNLENVQGDERDVILFSVCYGPDANGRVSMAFGPLNRQGGERRLNVAITRARERVMVFSSIRSDQIELARTRALGVRHLKTFLDYADRGAQALAEATSLTAGEDFDSPFEKQVFDALEQRGWLVDIQVGCSGYRIDLAVKDPDRLGSYLLGIECDGAFYHSASSARDRDRLREAVLVQLGWKLHRIWSSDWWQNPERELERVEAALLDAERSRPRLEVALDVGSDASDPPVDDQPLAGDSQLKDPAHDVADQSLVTERDRMPPARTGTPDQYRIYTAVVRDSDADFFAVAETESLRACLRSIVTLEAPILFDVMARRLTDVWNVSRLTARATERVRAVLASMEEAERPSEVGDVVWRRDQDATAYDAYRVPGDDRRAEDLPPVEVVNAARAVLRQQICLPRADLAREIARVFGITRLGKNVQAVMENGIAALEAEGACVDDGNGVRLT